MARFPRHKEDFDHADWLSLIDVSGPFLSVPVLRRVWPTLDALDKPMRERLRQEHAALPGRPWIEFVLTELLGWADAAHFEGLDGLTLEVPEHDAQVSPSFALLEPRSVPAAEPGADAKPVRLLGLVSEGSPTQRIKDSAWAATPVDRLAQLCRHHDVQLGLATDGRWWALVWAPRGGVTTTAVFDSVNWHEAAERDVVRAFVSILGRSRFFAVPDEETPVALLKASLDNQEEITEALGVQVRQAVELLVTAIGRAHAVDVASSSPLPWKIGDGDEAREVTAQDVYRAAVAVMMRVVFLLFAEERGLLPSDRELYRTAYSAGLLCAELEQRARDGSEEELENTYTGWHRLLALFNAVYYGVDHPDMPMPAYDGSIFEPGSFDWLPQNIDDRTVLHMLKAVQYVQIGTGRSRERRKLSFRTLDVEQIGYVYEGLLSFEGLFADEVVVGLIGKAGLEDEVPLATLEEFAAQAPDVPSLAATLATTYKDSRIGSVRALEKALHPLPKAEKQEAQRKLLAVTRGDYPLAERLLPFYGLLRKDLRDLPLVILPDALYVTESSLRKTTGTHYTPRFLAEQVVEGALEPLVYSPGPLQTADKSEWKPKSAAEILSLKVADIAMGSAAFLVAACRYLADHLVDAWCREGDEKALAYREQSGDQGADAEVDPVVIEARRQIIEHCLYGADINEMAVEMAKLSLWLVSMDPHRPFTFLDDRLIVGDSLLGITSLDQLEVMHMDPVRGRKLHKKEEEGALFDLTAGVRELCRDIADQRRALVQIEGTDLEKLALKRAMLHDVQDRASRAWLMADIVTGASLAHAGRGATGLDQASGRAVEAAQKVTSGTAESQVAAKEQLKKWLATDLPYGGFNRRPIHWPLAFPEVFQKGGFDAVIGNPPFLGGQKLTGSLGTAYREQLVKVIGYGARGSADLVAYFVLRAHALLNGGGQTGLITTNTIAQGDTREVGLDQLLNSGVTIRQAVKSRPWPSKSAILEFSALWTSKAEPGTRAKRSADDVIVPGITSSLDPKSRITGPAHRLAANSGISFQGSNILGLGFTMKPEDAKELIARDSRNTEILFPYLNGQDLNTHPDLSATRWVINFHDWTEAKAKTYSACFERVRSLVKPEREKVQFSKNARELWWRYERRRPELYEALKPLDRAIVIAQTSRTVMPAIVPARQVLSHMLVVFAAQDTALLSLLSSTHHYHWVAQHSARMKNDLRYIPSDCFETFPLPDLTQEMRDLGHLLDVFRHDIMLARQSGLTKTYNLIHDSDCRDVDILELRKIHKAIDEAVCRAYGWDDLIPQLEHGHYNLGREIRYTVTSAIQRELVDRLLELNHERYAAEVAAGLHAKKPKKATRTAQRDSGAAEQGGLF